jgi:hypothetical protein
MMNGAGQAQDDMSRPGVGWTKPGCSWEAQSNTVKYGDRDRSEEIGMNLVS